MLGRGKVEANRLSGQHLSSQHSRPGRLWTWIRARRSSRYGLLNSLLLSLVAATFSAIATVAIGAFAGAKGGSLWWLAIAGFAIVLVVLAPVLVSTMRMLDDFLMLSRVDTALLGGTTWHPDLSITGLARPAFLVEGDQFQFVEIRLHYKPIVTRYRGSIKGTARLFAEPDLFDFDSREFELSPDSPVHTLTFTAGDNICRGAAFGKLLAAGSIPPDGRVECTLRVMVESPWDLRTVPGTPEERKVELDLGPIPVQLINAQSWIRRMSRAGYLSLLPNGTDFNPVLRSDRSPRTGSNLVISPRRWKTAIVDRADPEAQLLLEVAARLMALRIASLPNPQILHTSHASHENAKKRFGNVPPPELDAESGRPEQQRDHASDASREDPSSFVSGQMAKTSTRDPALELAQGETHTDNERSNTLEHFDNDPSKTPTNEDSPQDLADAELATAVAADRKLLDQLQGAGVTEVLRHDLQEPYLQTMLEELVEKFCFELRTARGVPRSVDEGDGSRGKQSFRVSLQDLGHAAPPASDGEQPLTLIGLSDRNPGRHVFAAYRRATRGSNLPDVKYLDEMIDDQVTLTIAERQRVRDFPASAAFRRAEQLSAKSNQSACSASGQLGPDEIHEVLESVAALIAGTIAVVGGFYIQPQPVQKHYWLDLEVCSLELEQSGQLEKVQDAVLSTLRLMQLANLTSRHSPSPPITVATVFNCSASRGATSDHRFAPLRELTVPVGLGTMNAVYKSELGEWSGDLTPAGDSYVLSALSNDQVGFAALLNRVARRKHPATFLPFFGPLEPTHESISGLTTSASVTMLPLMVWEESRGGYQPSTGSDRYLGQWEILRRHHETSQGDST